MNDVLAFYDAALRFVESNPTYKQQVDWQRKRDLKSVGPEEFFGQYCWVVLASGFKVALARKYETAFVNSGETPEFRNVELLYKNERKRQAIRTAQKEYRNWFEQLQRADDKLAFLDSLPYIGPITKYHLAKNLGIDHEKPDVHMTRLSKMFGFRSVYEMVTAIRKKTTEKRSVIDLILWCYMSENPSYKREQTTIDSKS